MGRDVSGPRPAGGELMSRRTVTLVIGAGVALGAAVAVWVRAPDVGPPGAAAQLPSVRFRTALCRQSDEWCFVTAAGGVYGAILRRGGRDYEYRATVRGGGVVVVTVGPRGAVPVGTVVVRGPRGAAEPQPPNPVPGPLADKAAELAHALLAAVGP